MREKAAALFFVCASIAMYVGCSNTGTNRYLYAAIPGSNELIVYREDPNSGVLTQLAGSPITAGSAVQSIVIHPSKKVLLAANSGENDLSLFTISSTGSLTEVTPRTPTGTAPTVLAMDPGGTFLYVGNSGTNNISVFSINASSSPPTLTAVAGSPFPVGLAPLNIKVSPSGSFLYVTGSGSPGYVEAFGLTQGVLSPIATSPFVTGNGPYGLEITPDGNFLYTANKLDNSISEFTINSDGSLSQFSNSPIGQQYAGPVALKIDASGKYMYVANQGSTNVAAYSIGASGAQAGGLTLITSSPFTTGAQPSVIANDPTGKYLFVGNQTSPAIQAFSLDPGSGTLTSVATYGVPGTPTSIAITP